MADNAVFEGKAMVDKVLKQGVRVALGEFIHMYVKPLWKDSQNLYEMNASEQEEEKEGGDE